MTRRVRKWLQEVEKEFGIEIGLVKINPERLWRDTANLGFMEKVEALATWCNRNTQNKTPLVTFDGERIETEDDLWRILQEA